MNNTAASTDIISLLGTRDRMTDPRLLLPRRLIMGSLRGAGETQKSVWLWGARRVGKSSIGWRLKEQARERGFRTGWVDASDIASFEELADRIADALDPNERETSGPGRKRLEQLARSRTASLVVVDEADRISVTLAQPEQNFLRSRAEDGQLRYVFVSHIDPGRIVEETPDVASRLLGITQSVRVGLLAIEDVEAMFESLEKLLDIPGFASLSDRVWDEVGGHALSVMTLAHALAVGGFADPATVTDQIDRARAVLVDQMSTLWRDLSPGTRTLIENDSALDDDYCRSEALSQGFYTRRDGIVRPRMLLESRTRSARGLRSGRDECWNVLFDLYDRCREVNANAKAKFKRGWFEATDELRRGRVAAIVSECERDFIDVVNHLSKVVYEAARERDPSRSPEGDPMRWRIPAPLVDDFARSPGIKALRTLRNFYDHDPDARRTIDSKADRYVEFGNAMKRLCDHEQPYDSGHWRRAHMTLLGEINTALENLLDRVRHSADAPA